jgi:hypothetical protein
LALIADEALPYGLDVAGGERLRFSGAQVLVKASAETTGGAFSIVEEISPLDTPRHVHDREDELFLATRSSASAPEGLLGPRGNPTPSDASSRARDGRPPCAHSRASRASFRELADAESAGRIGPDAYARVSEREGVTWL